MGTTCKRTTSSVRPARGQGAAARSLAIIAAAVGVSHLAVPIAWLAGALGPAGARASPMCDEERSRSP